MLLGTKGLNCAPALHPLLGAVLPADLSRPCARHPPLTHPPPWMQPRAAAGLAHAGGEPSPQHRVFQAVGDERTHSSQACCLPGSLALKHCVSAPTWWGLQWP